MRNLISKHIGCAVVVWMFSISLTANAQTAAGDLRTAGIAAFGRDDLEEAERLFSQALRIDEDNQEHHQAGLDRMALGQIYHDLRLFPKAERTFDEALSIFEDEKCFNETAIVLASLASLSVSQHNYKQASEYLNEASLFSKRSGPAGWQAELHTANVFGMVYFGQGKYDKAEKYFKKAVALAPERELGLGVFPEVGLVEPLNNLATVYLAQRKYENAKESYVRALRLAQSEAGSSNPALAMMYFNLGSLYLLMERFNEAEAPLRRSIELAEKREKASASLVVGGLIALSKVEIRISQNTAAEALLSRAMAIARENAETARLIPDVLETYSQVLHSLNRPEEARTAFEEARRIRVQEALTVRVR